MAWDDSPQARRGYFYLWNPDAVFQAELDYSSTIASGKVSGEEIVQYLYVTNITLGALSDLRDGMTISLGSTAGAWDYGFCRVHGVINNSGTDVIWVWIGGKANKPGDLALGIGFDTRYITVWDEYRLWAKPPYYDDSGTGWYDGLQSNGTGGTNYNFYPVANGGPPVFDKIDPLTGVLTVDFDASRSFRVEPTAVLGSWTADLAPAATITSSSENGTHYDHNVVDGSTTTYWEPSAALPAWIRFILSSDRRVYKFSITASGSDAPKNFKVEVTDCERGSSLNYDNVFEVTNETAWGTNETRTYYIDVDHNNEIWGTRDGAGHASYRFTINSANGGTLRIKELKLYAEDRTGGATQAYTWDFADGTIITGDVNSEAPTVIFPLGKRYVHLTVEDSAGTVDIHHIPVVARGTSYTYELGDEADYSGASFADSAHYLTYTGAKLFDNHNATFWTFFHSNLPAWASITFTDAVTLAGYRVKCGPVPPTTAQPTGWKLQYYESAAWQDADSQTGQTGWTSYEAREFTLSAPVTATQWRLYVTAGTGSGGQALTISELDLRVATPVVDDQELPLSGVEVLRRSLTPEGQTLEVVFHEDISDYPEGALVLYSEDEFFDNIEGPCTEAEYTLVDRAVLKFWGWLGEEAPEQPVSAQGVLPDTRVICRDIGSRMAELPGWNLVFQREQSPSYSYEMRHANIDRMVWFVLRHISNAVNLADFFWSGLGDWYMTRVLGVYGADLYSMVDGRAQAMGFRLTCNKFGQLRLRSDQNLTRDTLRDTAATVALTVSDYYNLQWQHVIHPALNSLWSSALNTIQLNYYGTVYYSLFTEFTVAPGQVPIQGVQQNDQGEMVDDGYLRSIPAREANRFDNRLNPVESGVEFILGPGNDIGLDPANIEPFSLTLSAAYAAQRGQTFNAQLFYPLSVNFEYNNEGGYNTATVQAELYHVADYTALILTDA